MTRHAQHAPTRNTRLSLAYSYLEADFEVGSDTSTGATLNLSGNGTPEHIVTAHAVNRLWRGVDLDLWLRFVDEIREANVGSYLTLDARLAWRASEHLELAIVGQELLDSGHRESTGAELSPEVYGEVSYHF